YNVTIDASSSVPIAESYAWASSTFSGIDWSLDYPSFWYWLSLKINGSSPYLQTTAAQPSYADFTYQYTITPGIKSISNDNVAVLSATAPVNSTSTPSIVLENRLSVSTSTTITLSNLATSTYYQVTVDGSISSVVSGSACNDNRLCLTDSNGILSLTYLANDSSMHTLGLINYPGSFNLISPEDNYRVYSESSMPTLTWQASSDNGSGIAKYQLYIDDTLHTDNINSASTSIEISKPSEGLHHWYIKSVDNNGNITQSPSFSIIITTASGNDTFSSYTPTPSSISVPTQPISTTTQETITLTNTIRTLQIQLISLLQQLLAILLQTQRQI
ncbi:MAG TPA: hypothetical protein PK367_01180, partial [Candidatus Paceibacterota bacterium]|nr:hypothetical protein [Candidatus Paceibacterota bacterium]